MNTGYQRPLHDPGLISDDGLRLGPLLAMCAVGAGMWTAVGYTAYRAVGWLCS